MTVSTRVGVPMGAEALAGYFRELVNRFFKILPIREDGGETLDTYMRSLQAEILGYKELFEATEDDPMLLSLAATLQYFIDHPEMELRSMRREIFRAISVCNKLKARYAVPKEG